MAIGPQPYTYSDLLLRYITAACLALDESHYKADIVEERRAHRIQKGRQAKQRRYAKHGPAEFYAHVQGAA